MSTQEQDPQPTGTEDPNTNSGEPKKQKGRKRGSARWGQEETDLMLTIVEELCPAGDDMWKEAAGELYEASNGKYRRDGNAVKRKFEKMCMGKKPTGATTPPNTVVRAKHIKDHIALKEGVGHSGQNDSDDDENSQEGNKEEKGVQILKRSESGRPLTKKRKSTLLNEALDRLGEQQKESTKILADALVKGLATVGAAPAAATSTMERIDVVEDKLQRMDEKMDSKLAVILKAIQQNEK